MKDTSKNVEDIYNRLLLKRPPEERLKMGCSMFDLARSIIISSLPKGLSDTEKKQQLFLRLYSSDLEEEVQQKILRQMKNRELNP